MASPITQFASAGDGLARRYSSGTWAATRSAGSGDDSSSTATGDYAVWADSTNPAIARSFYPFDTSAIPDDATVSAASLFVYVTAKSSAAGGSFMVVESTQASTSSLANSDYSQVGTTELSSRVNFSAPSTSAYLEIPLNSAGLALINKTGFTKLALRSSFDLDNSAPSGSSDLQVKYSEQTGTSNDPYLTVTYSWVRTTSDAWAWSDTATGLPSVGRATSDAWAWSDTATQSRRTTADSWAWQDWAQRTGALSVNVNASAGDGYVTSFSSSWATAHDATTGQGAFGAVSNDWGVFVEPSYSSFFGDPNYYIYRGFFPFSMATVPVGATVASATLYVYVTAATSSAGGRVWLTTSTQASTTALATSDFDDVTTTAASDFKPAFADVTTGAYLGFPLNAAGLAAITPGGTAKFALRSSYDVSNTAPPLVNNTTSSLTVNYSENASNKPYLAVTYDNVRTTGDAWAWSDAVADAPVAKASGGVIRHRLSSDSWAWSDSASRVQRLRNQRVVVVPAGPHPVATSGSTVVPGSGTFSIVLASMPSGAVAGQKVVLGTGSTTAPAYMITIGGISGSTLTGCTGGLAGTYASGTNVSWHDAEPGFPSLTYFEPTSGLPHGRLVAAYLLESTDIAPDYNRDGEIRIAYSDDWGETWTRNILATSSVTPYYGIRVPTIEKLDNSGTCVLFWYENPGPNGTGVGHYDYTTTWVRKSLDYGLTWGTAYKLPDFFEPDIQANAPAAFIEGSDFYLGMYGVEVGETDYTGENHYSKLIKCPVSTVGTASHSWTEVAAFPRSLFNPAESGASDYRANGEMDICRLSGGGAYQWIAMFRVERDYTNNVGTLARWRCFSNDLVTWTAPTMVINNAANVGSVIQAVPGSLLTMGAYTGGGGAYQGTRVWQSDDFGVTWPVVHTDQFTPVRSGWTYNGARFINIGASYALPQVGCVWADANASDYPQRQSEVYFQWYHPFYDTADSWAWSDAAVGAITARSRTTSDSWAWSDVAVGTSAKSRTNFVDHGLAGTYADTWLWSDIATGNAQATFSRTSADAWAWSDVATQSTTGPAVRTTSDAWAWSDALARSLANSRTTSDLWRWVEPSATSSAPQFWLTARRRSSMSAPTKTYVQVLAKGTTRTSSYTSPTYKAETEAGILVVLDVTAASGTGGLTLRINAHDQASAQEVPLNAAPTAVTAIGTTSYALYPFGAVAGNVTQATEFYLPRMFSISVTAGDSSSYTYSLGFCLLP